jgi:hypothetical protein
MVGREAVALVQAATMLTGVAASPRSVRCQFDCCFLSARGVCPLQGYIYVRSGLE